MKTLIPITLLIFLFSRADAQKYSYPSDWIIKEGDTIECEDVKFHFSNLIGCTLVYKIGDEKYKLQGTEECTAVPTCYNGELVFDLVPADPERPMGKAQYMERWTDGAIRMNIYRNDYLSQEQSEHWSSPTEKTVTTTVTSHETTLYYFRLPNGKYYVLTKKNYEKYLRPVLLQCSETRKNVAAPINGLFIDKVEVWSLVTTYNYSCGSE